ncbi:MAG: pirin family protein [Verrucomicrobiaceae bacterium]|nr:pirin family protein [Verrucomicrobiaceae bacterium]
MSTIKIIKPHEKDLGGGFVVRRSLPEAVTRSIGPFIFFDHFGPVIHHPTDNFDVRPHPHIGLATVSYLFEGAMQHRDSLGSVQRIEPGAINWMTAGNGIVHSERAPDELRATPYPLHGLQLWAALPTAYEECEPAFSHTPASAIPVLTEELFSARVLIGSAFALTSPVETFSETLYVDFDARSGAVINLPAAPIERAIYLVSGVIEIDGETLSALQLGVLNTSAAVITVSEDARFVLIGGAAVDAPRFMWWNFVSSRKERIEQAKQDWQAQRMGSVAGETEFIPLPEQ